MNQNTSNRPGTLDPLLPGWHRKIQPAPHKGKETTKHPIRSKKDIATIKEALASNLRDYSLFLTGIHSGLRGSDLRRLRWTDIFDDEGNIRVHVSITEGKTKKVRRIALQPKVREALKNWRSAFLQREIDSPYVWPGRHGFPMTIQHLNDLVKRWCANASLKGNFGSHTLRKTFGYHLRKMGCDTDMLMKIFSHSSAAITLRYIGIEQEQIDEANLKLVL